MRAILGLKGFGVVRGCFRWVGGGKGVGYGVWKISRIRSITGFKDNFKTEQVGKTKPERKAQFSREMFDESRK